MLNQEVLRLTMEVWRLRGAVELILEEWRLTQQEAWSLTLV
jgi:hypothetical protein